MGYGLEFIRRLRPVSWRYTGDLDDGVRHYGFIAQDVDILASHKEHAFVVYDEKRDVYGLALSEFIGPIVRALQETNERIDRLERELAAEKGPRNETCHLGNDQASNHDPVGPRPHLEADMGDVRNPGKAADV